jgi:hypothetical protein
MPPILPCHERETAHQEHEGAGRRRMPLIPPCHCLVLTPSRYRGRGGSQPRPISGAHARLATPGAEDLGTASSAGVPEPVCARVITLSSRIATLSCSSLYPAPHSPQGGAVRGHAIGVPRPVPATLPQGGSAGARHRRAPTGTRDPPAGGQCGGTPSACSDRYPRPSRRGAVRGHAIGVPRPVPATLPQGGQGGQCSSARRPPEPVRGCFVCRNLDVGAVLFCAPTP